MIVVAITIIVLLTACFIRTNIAIEGFDQIDVDDLVYSERELHPNKKNRPIYSFPLPLPLDTVGGPQKNSSKIVKKELDYLVKLSNQKGVGERRKLCEKIEKKGSLSYFLNFAGKNGLVYDKAHLTTVVKDVETLSYLMKSYYNRPRPYQLGYLMSKNINPVILAKSSSYPCEHTMISKVLAHQLSYNNPKFKDQLHNIAKRIELSRYYGSLNFPSDTVASVKVADILLSKMKYLEGV